MNRFTHNKIQLFLFFLLIATTGTVLAIDPIYSLAEGQASEPISINVNKLAVDSLNVDQDIVVPLSDGSLIQGKVTTTLTGSSSINADISANTQSTATATKTWVVALQQQAGSLELTTENGSITKLLLFDANKVTYHRADIDSNGHGVLVLQDVNEFHCVKFPESSSSSDPIPLAAADDGSTISALAPNVSVLKTLQSRPGAANVIFIDYWGGTVSGTAWNDRNSGNDINYTPYSDDGDTTTFSEADRYRMWLGWRETAEDYAEFNVNVTTDINVFNATADTNKVRNIATTTTTAAPDSGGIAFVNVFGRDNARAQVSWSFNSGTDSLGQTISHEVGHQMGLLHDGSSTEKYYRGHANWGPIMGAPFGKKYVQFSKGEYPDANLQEDDLAIINVKLNASADEAGGDNESAQPIPTLPVADLEGVIAPVGLTTDVDIDVYQFTLPSNQPVDLSVAPLLPVQADNSGSGVNLDLGTNLSMQAFLLDSAGNEKAQTSPSGLPTDNVLNYSGQLSAGTYYIKIKALSDNPNWSGGFKEYGNGGFYSINIDADSSATCGGSFDLSDNQWRQISLPCNPGTNNKVSNIFGNIPGTYGTDWAVYSYDGSSYDDVGKSGTLQQGVGYWIIHKSGELITLTMPAGSTPTPTTDCASPQGCFEIPQPTNSGAIRWKMIGYPFEAEGTLSSLYATTGSGSCTGGCTLDAAETVGIINNTLWSYNGTNYTQTNTSGGTVNPWMGFWLPTLSNASSVAPVKLVVPKP